MVDPATVATAYTVASWACAPVVKLGGLGASYLAPMLGSSSTGSVVFSAMQSATTAGTAVTGAIGLPATIIAGGITYGAYRVWRAMP